MKALVLKDRMQLSYEEAPDPAPGSDEVLVRVQACGICGSDVHGLDGSTGRRVPPVIMGHEASGRVAESSEHFERGDRVTFDSTIYCGTCRFCRAGQINLCDRRRVLGVSCDEYRRNGALAELVVVPERAVYRLPDAVSFESAAMVEPLSVALHAIGRAAVRPEETAVVVGAGVIGLLTIQVLTARGCRVIAAVDIDEKRLAVAQRLGAAAINPRETDVRARVLDATAGLGADVAIEAVGNTDAVDTAVCVLRKGGRLALIGNIAATVDLPLQKVVTREIDLGGSCASSGEYPKCLELLAQGAVDVEPLISAVAPLADGAEWFRRLYNGEEDLLKVILKPSSD